MAAGGGRTLEETPTWAVAVVCVVLVAVSSIIEHIIHLIGKWLTKKNKKTLFEALERVKSELMLLGFISFLLTVGKAPITEFCVSKAVGDTWLPCESKYEHKYEGQAKEGDQDGNGQHRRLLSFLASSDSRRRFLATAGAEDKCGAQGKVPFLSADGLHQLHMFIFYLAVFHVLCCMITLGLGRAKMGAWKAWERETQTTEYQYTHDPERFRFARDTSFGRRHLSFWSRSPILLWMVCFVRQFVRSVPKVDYMTLRHGFIMAHLAPNSQANFDFQKYINRSLEEDFKVVVGISPPMWFLAVLFLMFNTNGWKSYLWLPFIPLIIILLVGTKLQVIITKMGLRIQERGEIVKGTPVVQPTDDLFWFKRPGLLLYLIHFVLFQNAFQLAFFAWSWMEFGPKSCFHSRREDFITRISMGVIVQILCSYVTLPLYALVTQMGSSMKPTIFDDKVVKALQSWRQTAKKNVKQNRNSNSVSPLPSRPTTPMNNTSPIHLLHYYQDEVDYTIPSSPQVSYFHNTLFEAEGSINSLPRDLGHESEIGDEKETAGEIPNSEGAKLASQDPPVLQHEIDIQNPDFSFDKSTRV